MTAALLSLVGVLVVGAAARLAVASSRRCEVRWRLPVAGGGATRGVEPVVASAVTRATARWQERPPARRRRLVAELPATLDEVARALRSGASLRQALAGAAAGGGGHPVGGAVRVAAAELRAVVERVERGMALVPALEQWAVEQPLPEVRLVATAIGVVAEAGGNAAQAVESVAATLRERHAAVEEVRVQSVQARLSATVIALLPLGFTVWCITTDPKAASFLLGTAAGWLCLTGGLALLAAGGWWMARIIGSAG